MLWRAPSVEVRVRARQVRSGRRLDVIVTHAPPPGCGDRDDPAHQGFAAFHWLIDTLAPNMSIHGHVDPLGHALTDRHLGHTLINNAVPSGLIEI